MSPLMLSGDAIKCRHCSETQALKIVRAVVNVDRLELDVITTIEIETESGNSIKIDSCDASDVHGGEVGHSIEIELQCEACARRCCLRIKQRESALLTYWAV